MKVTRAALRSQRELWLGAATLLALSLISAYSYLLFHSIAELFSIVVAGSLFLLTWNTRRFFDNGYLLFISVAFLFIGGLDLIHTLAFKGMGVFPGDNANLPTQLWIAARYLQSLAFLLAPLFIGRRLQAHYVLIGWMALTSLVLASIFYWKIFPDCYVEGQGLTPFKKISENIISLLLLASLGLLWRKRQAFDRRVWQLLALGILASIASELVFTTYVSVYDWANLTGHLFKIIAFYLLYKAIVHTGLVTPYNLIFRDLKQSEEALRGANERLEERVAVRTSELSQANEQLRVELEARRRAEAEIRRLNEELEQHVVERTAQLAATNSELEKAIRLRDHFFAIASHELRTPLTAMLGYAEILGQRAERHDDLDDVDRRAVRSIHQQTLRLNRLILALLDVSRIENGRLSLELEPLNITDLVQRVVQELQPGLHRHRLVLSAPLAPISITGDELRLDQVLHNLVQNAIKYSPQGGTVPICVERRGEWACIAIRDQGIGIPASALSKLFDRFYRAPNAEGMHIVGMGIGLFVVKEIVDLHGGRVEVESQEGIGSTFTVYLPLEN